MERDDRRPIVIVHGDCPEPWEQTGWQGAAPSIDHTSIDQIARRLGEECYDGHEPHPADWDAHGKGAGPIRNAEMAVSRPDFAILLPGGKGTESMMRALFAAQIPFEFVVP